MKIVKIIIALLLLTLSANAGWKQLKGLKYYGAKAFTLKQGVVYVEIRKYRENGSFAPDLNNKPTVSRKKEVFFRMYRYPLSHFSSAIRSSFQKVPPVKKYCFKEVMESSFPSCPRLSWACIHKAQ